MLSPARYPWYQALYGLLHCVYFLHKRCSAVLIDRAVCASVHEMLTRDVISTDFSPLVIVLRPNSLAICNVFYAQSHCLLRTL